MWDYFLYSEENDKSICQVPVGEEGSICGKEINGRYPTNLKAHLKHLHPIEHMDVQQKSEEKGKEKDKARKKIRPGKSLWKDLHIRK